MCKIKSFKAKVCLVSANNSEKGASMVIALLVLLLLMGFATLVISRVSTETIITTNDSYENQAFAATMAHLESTTRDFADVFERKLTPAQEDIDNVEALRISDITDGFENYEFDVNITPIGESTPTEISGGVYSGLYALRDEYQVDVTTTDSINLVQTQLRRTFFNDRIPLFQFGIFFEDDLELNRPPLFTFGGRVHTNQNFFVTAAEPYGIFFRSRATAVGEVVNDIWKTKQTLLAGYDDQGNVNIADAGGTFRELETGKASVNCTSPEGENVFAYDLNLPVCSKRSEWDSDKEIFQGNLDTNVPRLDLPLYRLNIDLIELIRRGKNIGDLENDSGTVQPVTAASQDPPLISRERFSNKEGIRISLADSQQRLPGCATITTGLDDCGVRLDRPMGVTTIGYQPLAMSDGYQATPLNATRMAQTGKEIWIKVELVNYDYVNDKPITTDVTAEFLSLGVTERAPIDDSGSEYFEIENYSAANENDINSPLNDDIRSIIKLQRFAIPGVVIDEPTNPGFLADINPDGNIYNIVARHYKTTEDASVGCTPGGTNCTAYNGFAAPLPSASSNAAADNEHIKWAKIKTAAFNRSDYWVGIVPFPIKIYDTREGVPDDSTTYTDTIPANNVTRSGSMSMIDIDIANLRRFLEGDFDDFFPLGPTPFTISNSGTPFDSSYVPENRGWVLYISDRRGDTDFDGEYDMEDVFPDDTLQYNEDVNANGTLETSFGTEAPNYTDYVSTGVAATSDHGYYRRGVRLINATTLPGIYDSDNPDYTKGFSVGSENGVYIKGNYNVTSVTLTGSDSPAPSQNYEPQNTALHIPSAISADAVTILSNNWRDSRSFQFPFAQESRLATATQVRFAMLTGDGITGNTDITYNPSFFGQLNGGIHNFKRFLERWTDVRLNYTGSLVNLFNSRNNNGFWKCCSAVYNPPIRDWTFDTTFLDPNRLPPGTPYIYTLSFTGFQRVNN